MGDGMSTFESFLAEQYPGADISELSGSNNVVYSVKTESGPIIAKHVTDSDIPLSYLADVNDALSVHLPVQRIFRVCEQERGDAYDAVFSEYVEGENLATVVAEEPDRLPAEELVAFLCRFVEACRELPGMHGDFGLYKREAPSFGTHVEFVTYYARRYWGRVRPFYEGTSVAEAVDAWLEGGFAAALRAHPASYGGVPIDANLKNFVLTPDGRLVVLNVPIVGRSTPAHAVGAIGAHLRHHEAHDLLLDAVKGGICADDLAMVPHFEVSALLGIMSFYAVREPEAFPTWRNWGSPVTLDHDLRSLIATGLMNPEAR
ncbi:hypothetical protein K378_02536 [Streptomyces sp. Amel2xB2]|nr:hypothetical protein K378_02536 [Streptomyces sp. Amel2xB2]